MNYYIQGNKEKADKIKAAFKELGINVLGFGFANKAVVYCSIDECVQYLPYSINLMNILYSHPDYKELELAVKSKFKVGDKIEATIYGIKRRVTIREVDKTNRCYFGTLEECIGFSEQDKWHLAPKPHYDISNFHAGMPVLVRDSDEHKWLYTIFGIYNKDNLLYPFVVVNMRGYEQCIPFEGNEHLLGTTNMCPEEYINW